MSPGPAEPAVDAAARHRRIGRAVAVLAAVGATLLPELPALGAPPAAALPLVVTIDEQRFGVAAGDPMTFDVTISGDGGATVTVALHDVVDAAAQLVAIDDRTAGPALDSVALDLAALPADAAGDATAGMRATVTVPTGLGAATAGDRALTAPGPGIYPVTIAVVDDGVTVGSTTTIVELFDPSADPDTGATRLALLASVDDPGPWPTAGALTAARAGIDGARALSTAVSGPLSVRLPPALLTSTESIPGGAGAFDGDELLAQPAIPLDPSSISALGRAGLFTDQLVAGENAAAAAAPLAARTRTVWLVDGPLSTGGAALLRDLGVQLVIVPADVAADLGVAAGADTFQITLDSADSVSGLVISPLGAGLATPEPGTSAAVAAARVMAAVELGRSGDQAPAAVALATRDLGLPDPSVTAAFVGYAGELPGVSIVPVSDLAGQVGRALSSSPPQPPVGLPAEAEAGADLSVRAAAIDAERDDAEQARSMLVDTADADAWDAGFDDLLARTIDDGEAAVHLAAITAQIDGILGAIIPPEPFTFTLTGTESDLRLTITNTASQPLRAVVRVRSAKLAAAPQEPVVVPAQQELVVPVPVTARSNGTFTVEVDVLTPAGQRIAGPVALRGSVRRVTGLSQLVTGGAALALASWWYSHFRRNRRARLAANGRGPGIDANGADESLSPDAAEARSAAGDQRSR